jgi:hypothetical protein
MPEAAAWPDGYLRVHYDRLGVKFRTYDQWLAQECGSRAPSHRSPFCTTAIDQANTMH